MNSLSSLAGTSATAMARPMGRVERALLLLRQAGVPVPDPAQGERPLARLLQDLAPLDEAGVTALVRVLGRTESFNEVVRSQMAHADIGQRYAVLAQEFASARADASRLIERTERGQTGAWVRLADMWMRLTRGNITRRFERIKGTARSLFRSSEDLLARMRAVLEAYAEFRIGLKEAGILSLSLQKKAEQALAQAREHRDATQAALDREESGPDGAARRAEQEISRDEAARALRAAERREQLARDLAENLSVAYHTGEVVMARLAQTTTAQERVWSRSVSFFQTNESVLTALAATLTSTQGLDELARGQNVLVQGTNDALRDLAIHGGRVHRDAIQTGYGATIDVQAVRALVDAIVAYEKDNRGLVAELRQEASANTAAVAQAVAEGQQRLAALAASAPLAPQVSEGSAS